MLSTHFVVAGLSTGNKIGLATVAAIFIIFALVSSFVLPRRYPNFPGRSVGWYSALAVLFLIAMISAVLIFGKESEEPRGGLEPEHADGRDGSAAGDHAERRRRRRRGCRQGGLRLRRLRRLPHAEGGGRVGERRPEPGRAAPELQGRARPGRARRRRDARLPRPALASSRSRTWPRTSPAPPADNCP